jgi:hypothetical protein
MRGPDDEAESPLKEGPARPKLVIIACIIWAVLGFFNMLFIALLAAGFIAECVKTHSFDNSSIVLLPVAAFNGFIAFLFCRASIQTYRCKAQDMLWSGIGSLIYGILMMLPEGILGKRGTPGEFHVWYLLIFSGPSLAAGILALIGNRKYKTWREENLKLRAAQGTR